MSEFTCDECGTEVADGHGHYIGASHRRYCAECAEADYAKRYGTLPIDEVLYAEYRRGGQYAVYDYVRAVHPDWQWSACEPCEDTTPTRDEACAVCGTEKEQPVPVRRWTPRDESVALVHPNGDVGDTAVFAPNEYETVIVVAISDDDTAFVESDTQGGWVSRHALYART